ncbi:bglB, partial [Symbiodinium pilosum]
MQSKANAGNHSTHLHRCFGKLCVRAILYLTRKQKYSREKTNWSNLEDILQAFTQEVQGLPSQDQAADAATNSSSNQEVVADLSAASAATVAMMQNSHMYTMPKEHGQKVFEFQKIEDAGAIMVHRPVLAPEEEVHVPLADLKKWRVTKTGMPQLASLEMIQRGLPQGNAICQEDLQRVQIAAALHAAHEQHALDPEDIAFSCQPQGLYTLKAVKKAALHLVPLGSIAKLKGPGETSKKLTIDHFGHKWTINAFKQDSMLQGTADAGCLTPFFWCK